MNTAYVLIYQGEDWGEEFTEVLSVHMSREGAEIAAARSEEDNWGSDARSLNWVPYDGNYRAKGLQSGEVYYHIISKGFMS